MKGYSAAVLVSVLLSGCVAVGARGPTTREEVRYGECSPTPCVVVRLDPIPSLSDDLSDVVREKISDEVAKVLYASIDIDSEHHTADLVLSEVRARLEEYKQVSSAPIEWNLDRFAKVLFQNGDVVAVEVVSQGYLGGAHGFNDRVLLTFDAKKGSRLGVWDVFEESSKGVLPKVVEAEFRRARSLRKDESLQEAGFFLLPGQEMPLADNFALTEKGLELHYNPYEVGPYALGETRVTIPKEAIEPMLKAELRSVFSAPAAAPSMK